MSLRHVTRRVVASIAALSAAGALTLFGTSLAGAAGPVNGSQVPGAAATKMYRCPGCDQEILPGTAHIVAWPAQTPGPAERRHWHNACWQRRPRRPGPRMYR